jgi:hypothetical protein
MVDKDLPFVFSLFLPPLDILYVTLEFIYVIKSQIGLTIFLDSLHYL